ncbi:MAG: TetR/AcrR family transcriptional regulator, partial [Stackebrandtia sp.]
MEDIASRLDISSAALYRHYPSKYALFREELLRLAALTVTSTTVAPEHASLPIDERIDGVLDAMISATIANRPTVTLARWEGRYLDETDGATLDEQFATSIRALAELVRELRPDLAHRDRL